jgi:hypothetical protein
MTIPLIRIGVVVRDSHKRVGIVCSKERAPTRAWINEQRDSEEIRKLGQTSWWGVMPLVEGGHVLEAEPFLTYLRDATYDDVLIAADSANVAGRKTLVKTFPHFVNRILAERSDE